MRARSISRSSLGSTYVEDHLWIHLMSCSVRPSHRAAQRPPTRRAVRAVPHTSTTPYHPSSRPITTESKYRNFKTGERTALHRCFANRELSFIDGQNHVVEDDTQGQARHRTGNTFRQIFMHCTTVALSVSSPSRAPLKASISTRTMQESTVGATGTLAVSASADASVKGTTAYDGSNNELTGAWRSPEGTNAW